MIRYSVLYPATEGAAFDHDYYRDTHVPLAAKTWNPVRVEIDKQIDGPYVAAVHFTFESFDAMQRGARVRGDRRQSGPISRTTRRSPRSVR